jgi:hypothetical protein
MSPAGSVSKDAFAANEMAQWEFPGGHSVPPMLIRPLLGIVTVSAALALSGTAHAAPQRVAFEVTYAYSGDHFTKLSATAPVTAMVKHPHQQARRTTLKALVGKKLQIGTKIIVSRGKAKLTLSITPKGVR